MSEKISERKVRRKRKSTVFTGQAITFKTNNSFPNFLRSLFRARWSVPSWTGALLLMVFVFVYSSNFLILLNPLDALESLTFSKSGGGVADSRSENIERIKANIGIGIYVFVLIYSLFFLRPIMRVLRAHPHIVLIVLLLLISMSYSINPKEVFFSTVQIVIGILIALVYAIQTTGKERWDRRFCLTILFPLFVVHLYSFVLFFANGLNAIEFMQSSSRFGGLPGNPNVAGASAVIGLFTSLYVLLNSSNRIYTRLYCIVALCLFVFTIIMAGSGTSITVSIAVTAMLVWLKFLTLFQSQVNRAVYIISGVFIMTMFVGFIMINNSTEELTETFTSSLGKQTDFTGRTDLWGIAIAAIEEKPLLGWSYDYHETVQENRAYELPFGLEHFHNGFLDTAVAGGLVLLMVVVWNLFSYVRYYFKVRVARDDLYGFIGPVVVLILMNLSEYSLLRPLSVVFQFYLCAYFLLVLAATNDNEGYVTPARKTVVIKPPSSTRGRKRRSKGEGVRYRF